MKWALVLVPALAMAQTAIYHIAGTVVDGLSGQPLANVRVMLTPAARQGFETASWMTAEDGKFAFDVPQGNYAMIADRRAMLSQFYSAKDSPPGLGIGIVTGPGQDTSAIRFALWPPSVITGKVTEDNGEPVEGATVQLLRFVVLNGRFRATSTAWAHTDDLGEYRFSSVLAGRYTLTVTGTPWYAHNSASMMDVRGMQLGYAPVASGVIALKSGQEARADFTMHARPGSDVTVKLTGAGVAPLLIASLTSESEHAAPAYQATQWVSGGSVRFNGIQPGSYVLRVRTPASQISQWAQPLEVGAQTAEVSMDLPPLASLDGTVVLPPGFRVPFGVLLLSPEGAPLPVPVTDGAFHFSSLGAGDYQLSLAGTLAAHITAIYSGDDLLSGYSIHVKPGENPKLRIVTSDVAGAVNGIVTRDGKPAAGLLVVMIAVKGAAAPPFTFMTDSDGSFSFEHAPPGDYRLFATDDLEFEWGNPKVVQAAMQTAQRVAIEAGKAVETKLAFP